MSQPTTDSTAFLQSAYEHCARIAIGMLTSQGNLAPQLFFVGGPARVNDASTSKIARVGPQAMAAFHASEAGASQLAPFIQRALDPSQPEARALRPQIGQNQLAVHACHALMPASTPMPALPHGALPACHPDGRLECVLVTVHTSQQQYTAYCPVYRNAAGELRSAIAPLNL